MRADPATERLIFRLRERGIPPEEVRTEGDVAYLRDLDPSHPWQAGDRFYPILTARGVRPVPVELGNA